MKSRRNPFVAREGIPFLAVTVLLLAATWHFAGPIYAIVPFITLIWLITVFRDPVRIIPAVPLGAVSPVDGTVVEVGLTGKSAFGGEAHRIVIKVSSFGSYTARAPVEGKILDFRTEVPASAAIGIASGLWVQTDEGDNVVLQFHGHRLGFAPRAFIGYGERVGQGQRCAYLRLTRFAEVQLPINSRILVREGQEVAAGIDVLAKLPPP